MEWVYLLVWVNSGMVVMPDKYPETQCEEIQKKNVKGYVLCVPAPKLTIMKDEDKLEQFKNKYGDCKMEGMMMVCPPIYRPN